MRSRTTPSPSADAALCQSSEGLRERAAPSSPEILPRSLAPTCAPSEELRPRTAPSSPEVAPLP
eukprot:1252637-Alexandrium_andersonii.AAC.1